MSSTFVTSESNEQVDPPLESEHSVHVVARVNLDHLLARALGPVADLDAGDPELLAEIVPYLVSDLQESVASMGVAWNAALDNCESLAIAYTRLFLGPFEILAPPYESLYLDPERRLMGQVTQEVAQEYAKVGLAPSSQPNEIPDHITHELEFMYYLGFQGITTENSSWHAQRQQFWNDHLGRWLGLLADNILQADAHAFYSEVARVLKVLSSNAPCENPVTSAPKV